MATFIYVQRVLSQITEDPYNYKVLRFSASETNFRLVEAIMQSGVLTAIIRQQGEELLGEFEEKTKTGKFRAISLGGLEFIVLHSQLIVHEPVPSQSPDSDAFYFGENDKLGLLLQYLGPEAWRTHDPVAHTSVHHHTEGEEAYHLLHGAASIILRAVDAANLTQLPESTRIIRMGLDKRGDGKFTVPKFTQHPVIGEGGVPSVMLIVTNPPNNSRNDHHYKGLFREEFAGIIASYTQRMRGLSAAGLEGGSQPQ